MDSTWITLAGGGTGGAMGTAGALGAALGRGGCTSLLLELKLSMAVVVAVLVDEAAGSFQH